MMKYTLTLCTVLLLAMASEGQALTINLGGNERDRYEEQDRYARRRARSERHRRDNYRPDDRRNSTGWEKLLRDKTPPPPPKARRR